MNRNFFRCKALIFGLGMVAAMAWAGSKVLVEDNSIFLVDLTGERWEINQAATIGFWPEGFQYGIGRHAFTPLNDSDLKKPSGLILTNPRVIGVADRENAHAYVVSKMVYHEIANTTLNHTPIAAGY